MNNKLFFIFMSLSLLGNSYINSSSQLPPIKEPRQFSNHHAELVLCLQISDNKGIKRCLSDRRLHITKITETCVTRRLEVLDTYLKKNPDPKTKELKREHSKYVTFRKRTLDTAQLLINRGMNPASFKDCPELANFANRRASAPTLPAIKPTPKKKT